MSYGIIYADPPWHYNNAIDKLLNKSLAKTSTPTAALQPKYPTMQVKDIAALDVKSHLAEDAACFMWTTDPFLPDAIEIMKAWGFTYKNIGFVWAKTTNKGNFKALVAPWTNKGVEVCLFGTKGAMTKHLGSNSIKQLVIAERTSHSTKPEEVAHRIDQMFPTLKKIELFARRHRPGWDVWGNDPAITNSITL